MNGPNNPSSAHPSRTDPVLGDVDKLDAGSERRGVRAPDRTESGRSPPRSPRRPPRAAWIALIVVVAVVGAGAWAFTHQTMLRSLLPQTQLNTLLTRGDAALAAGELAGGPDSARALYQAARVLDPDNEHALAGLRKVGEDELARARAALKRQDYASARTALEQARSLLGGGDAVAGVDRALSKAVLQDANVEVMISQARAALANGRIDGTDGAAALFGKVLAGEPHNAVARHGMDEVGNVLATRVQRQLASGDRVGAGKTLAELAALVPGYSQLPSLRATIAAAERAAATQRDQHLAQAEADLREGKLAGGGQDNAEAQFKAALALDPGNTKATAGLAKVARALIERANGAIDSGTPKTAVALLDQAAVLAPQSSGLAAARARLAAASDRDVAAATKSDLTPAESDRVTRLVARASAAARAGDIMLPPGDSAYDLYRAALGIDGDNAEARTGLQALPGITRDVFARALKAGSLTHAHDMLATLEQLSPRDPATGTMRHRLGNAWLDRAERDVREGRPAAARTALDAASQLVPGDPRLAEVGARLKNGGRP